MTFSAHADSATLEQYVLGVLPATEAQALEAHAAVCALCAASLAREARLEVALQEAAVRLRVAEARLVPKIAARVWPYVAALAVAASVLVALPPRHRARVVPAAPPRVTAASHDLLDARIGDVDLEGLDVPMGQTGQAIASEPMTGPATRHAQDVQQ